jgi:hypothetical protein
MSTSFPAPRLAAAAAAMAIALASTLGCDPPAPAQQPQGFPDVFPVMVSAGVAPGEADGCDGDAPPVGRLRGRVYDIPLETRLLPDFAALSPVETICLDQLAVTPRRSVYPAIPGLKDRYKWFALDLQGVFDVEHPGLYYFRLTSDDGSQLFIDDTLVVDNDGYHPARLALGAASITAGRHTIRVAYWQGPGPLALMLDVARPGESYGVLRVDQPL